LLAAGVHQHQAQSIVSDRDLGALAKLLSELTEATRAGLRPGGQASRTPSWRSRDIIGGTAVQVRSWRDGRLE